MKISNKPLLKETLDPIILSQFITEPTSIRLTKGEYNFYLEIKTKELDWSTFKQINLTAPTHAWKWYFYYLHKLRENKEYKFIKNGREI